MQANETPVGQGTFVKARTKSQKQFCRAGLVWGGEYRGAWVSEKQHKALKEDGNIIVKVTAPDDPDLATATPMHQVDEENGDLRSAMTEAATEIERLRARLEAAHADGDGHRVRGEAAEARVAELEAELAALRAAPAVAAVAAADPEPDASKKKGK